MTSPDRKEPTSFLNSVRFLLAIKRHWLSISIIVSCLIVIMAAGTLFLVLPTSIFGEASDINHDQRDETVIEASHADNLDYATSNENLISALDAYRVYWNKVDTENQPTPLMNETAVGRPLATITSEEFELICAIIAQESGDTYDGALAVASCVANRIAQGGWLGSWDREKRLTDTSAGDSDPLAVLTASGQFAAYIDYDYLKYMGAVPENVRRAATDCFVKGVRNNPYTCFRSYPTAGSTEIEGNHFFAPFSGDSRYVVYNIGDLSSGTVVSEPQQNEGTPQISTDSETTNQEDSQDQTLFSNTDPNGEENWDLLYLLCAYDASKNNLEGVPLDGSGNPTTRYQDLLYGIGEYIIKACFGVEITVEKEKPTELSYPIYEKKEITVLENNALVKKTVYVPAGEAKTKIKLIVPVYEPVEVTEVENFSGQVEKTQVLESPEPNKIKVKEDENEVVYDTLTRGDYFQKAEKTQTLEPSVEKVRETRRVRGLQKSVLLSVLGLEPNDPYKVLGTEEVTNADYIEYSRQALINVLDLDPSQYGFSLSPSDLQTPVVGSSTGWVWPLDPNGANVYVITSMMGTRESPGGIGSTNHGGTDIGASYGVTILAADTGTVEIASSYGGYGNCVRILHDRTAEGNVYQTIYGHMSRIATTVGKRVQKGEVIGYVGSTGWSTGPHLHFEVHCNGEKVNGLSMYGDDILSKLTYP